MDNTLRSKIIRLAHQQPELRPHLLPLLKSAGMDDFDSDDNPFGLYEGHERVTKAIQSEIEKASTATASAYKAIEKLIKDNEKFGTRDSDSTGAIWDVWRDAMKGALVGKK